MPENDKEHINQRLNSLLVTVFHVVTAMHFCFAMYYDYVHVNVDASVLKAKRTQFGGKFKFLTFINCVSAQFSQFHKIK